MPPDKKVSLTISTLSGDATLEFPPNQKLKIVVERTINKLNLVGTGPWVLDKAGVVLDQDQTIEDAGLVDGDILTLSPEEGGGGSNR
jgi:hypothetical protein